MGKKIVLWYSIFSYDVDRHFSRTNHLLEEKGIAPIDWQLWLRWSASILTSFLCVFLKSLLRFTSKTSSGSSFMCKSISLLNFNCMSSMVLYCPNSSTRPKIFAFLNSICSTTLIENPSCNLKNAKELFFHKNCFCFSK